MKKTIKAVLLSAFVYPGVGHFSLKKYPVGFAFASIFTVPLYFLFKELFLKAESIAEQIQTGQIPLDVAALHEALSSQALTSDTQTLNFKLYALIIIWLIATVDAYRIAKVQTREL